MSNMASQPLAMNAAANRPRSLGERIRRWARYRFIVPLKRSRHPPDYVARGVGVGLFWAMTPTIGVQMACVLLHWLAVRRIGRWEFNVIHAMAWTWVTNVAVMFPVYYMFYVTGQVLLGRWHDLTGYHGFLALWGTTFGTGDGGERIVSGIEIFLTYFDVIIVIIGDWGLAMIVGCVPYAVVAAWLGYRWSLGIVTLHRRARLERRIHRHHDHAGDGASRHGG